MLWRPVAQLSPVGARLFRTSAPVFAGRGVNDRIRKKVKKVVVPEGAKKPWIWKREKRTLRDQELKKEFEAIKDVPVIHYQPPTLQAWVHNLQREPVGIVALNRMVFGQEIRPDIVHRVVRWQRAAWQQGTHHAKTRAERRGGGRKPRPQKGTGQARLGSIRSPLMRGGGKAHPPRTRSHAHKLPRRIVDLGMKVALSAKFAENNMHVIKDTMIDSHKTRELRELLDEKWGDMSNSLISVVTTAEELDPNFALAARNLWNIDFYTPETANVYDLVKRHHLLVTESALSELEAKLVERATTRRTVKFVSERAVPKLSEVSRITVSSFRRKQANARQQFVAARERAELKHKTQVLMGQA